MEHRQNGILQQMVDQLTNYNNEEQELVMTRKARTVFNKKSFKRKAQDISFTIDVDPTQTVPGKVREVIQRWATRRCNGRQVYVCTSDRLPLHLNLPVRTYPEDCFLLQVLALAAGLPPIFLTLYTEDSVDPERPKEKETLEKKESCMKCTWTQDIKEFCVKCTRTQEIKEFCMTCTRMLTSSLLNFCHREFLILPCTMPLDDTFTAEALQREVDDQLDDASEYYGGPEDLSQSTCDDLIRAVSIAATATSVPCFLSDVDNQKKEWLHLMDPDWDRTMRHMINDFLDGSKVSVTYTSKTETKTKAAVLEAARRVSYSHKVVVVTTDEHVHRAVERLARSAQEEHGLEPHWFRSEEPGENIPEADRVIVIDVEDCTQLLRPHLTVSRRPAKPDGEELLRVLLVGKSGSGKSSTANTLLGRPVFESGVSFTQVTKTNPAQRATYQGRKIEVVDSPGIFDITRDTGVDGDTLAKQQDSDDNDNDNNGFDVVCYVIKIERFTQEDVKVFHLLKDILGPEVLQHMIVIFTHGDCIEEGESFGSFLEEAPKPLKDILDDCHNRYVVFDNLDPRNKAQVDEFFRRVKTLNRSPYGERLRYVCPDATELENRRMSARQKDIAARQLSMESHARG